MQSEKENMASGCSIIEKNYDEFCFMTFQDKEVTNGGSAPRILSIDDYFMAEHDIVFKDSDTGKTITKTVSKSWTY